MRKHAGLKIDQRAFSVTSGFDNSDDMRYWHSRTPQARIRQMEILRRINYGHLATKKMKHVLEIVERGNSAD